MSDDTTYTGALVRVETKLDHLDERADSFERKVIAHQVAEVAKLEALEKDSTTVRETVARNSRRIDRLGNVLWLIVIGGVIVFGMAFSILVKAPAAEALAASVGVGVLGAIIRGLVALRNNGG